MVNIKPLDARLARLLSDAFQDLGWNKPLSQFLGYLQEAEQGLRTNLVALQKNLPVGYTTILWQSDHPYFQEKSIPEIKDLNVLPEYRNQGIATALMDAAEGLIWERFPIAGIGVGLTADYASAQRLYVKRGYLPTIEGATSYHQTLEYGKSIVANDDLVLWFTKCGFKKDRVIVSLSGCDLRPCSLNLSKLIQCPIHCRPPKEFPMPSPSYIPEGFHTITPFLIVRDAEKAIEFYKKAFGAVEQAKPLSRRDQTALSAVIKYSGLHHCSISCQI